MEKMIKMFNKTAAGTIIAYMWIIASILMFLGVGDVSDQTIEKIYSIDMVIIGFFFTRKPDKEDLDNSKVTIKTEEVRTSNPA